MTEQGGGQEKMERQSEVKASRFKRICVFCGSSQGKKTSYQEAAIQLGEVLVFPNLSLSPSWCLWARSFNKEKFWFLHVFFFRIPLIHNTCYFHLQLCLSVFVMKYPFLFLKWIRTQYVNVLWQVPFIILSAFD